MSVGLDSEPSGRGI